MTVLQDKESHLSFNEGLIIKEVKQLAPSHIGSVDGRKKKHIWLKLNFLISELLFPKNKHTVNNIR